MELNKPCKNRELAFHQFEKSSAFNDISNLFQKPISNFRSFDDISSPIASPKALKSTLIDPDKENRSHSVKRNDDTPSSIIEKNPEKFINDEPKFPTSSHSSFGYQCSFDLDLLDETQPSSSHSSTAPKHTYHCRPFDHFQHHKNPNEPQKETEQKRSALLRRGIGLHLNSLTIPSKNKYLIINPHSGSCSSDTTHESKKRIYSENEDQQKRCSCSRSKCLKLYCECFAAGKCCSRGCSCENCFNLPEHAGIIFKSRQKIKSRDPLAFSLNLTLEETNNIDVHRRQKGCNCKKSNCLKKYCDCFRGGVGCSSVCQCEGCKNCFNVKSFSIHEVESGQVNPLQSSRFSIFDLGKQRCFGSVLVKSNNKTFVVRTVSSFPSVM